MTDYWGGESVDLNVDEAVEVDLNGNPVVSGVGRDIPKSIIDEPGDLIVGVAADTPARFPIGDAGQALVVDEGGTSLAWATPASQEHTHEEYAEDDHVHPEFTHAHDEYATDADLAAHAATSHGTAHPDLAAHDTLGLATQAELDAHAGTAHQGVSGRLNGGTLLGPRPTLNFINANGFNAALADDAGNNRLNLTLSPLYGTPGASTFGDTASAGTANNHARSDHRHSREANPVTAHEAAADPHAGYLLESKIAHQASAPSSPAVNDLWLDTDEVQTPGMISPSALAAGPIAGYKNGGATTTGNPTVANTWQNGTTIITIPNPGMAVMVTAAFNGYGWNFSGITLSSSRVSISFDGGSTWQDGLVSEAVFGQGGGNYNRGNVSSAHFRTGTPTGSIQIKVQFASDTANTLSLQGTLIYTMMPV